jgi:hypothetical protein
MIFLKELNLLFLKPTKVAGTSFEIVLSKFASADDIITRVSPEDEKMRNDLGFRGAQNYRKAYRQLTIRDIISLVSNGRRPRIFFNHISASEAKAHLGSKVFDQATKVSIVRNPFDRLVSSYHWQARRLDTPPPPFADWMREQPHLINKCNAQYFVDGKNVIDHYLRYDRLSDDIAALEEQFPALRGASQLMSQIKAKGHTRPKERSVSEYYEAEDDLVSSVKFFNRTLIDKFGFDLE